MAEEFEVLMLVVLLLLLALNVASFHVLLCWYRRYRCSQAKEQPKPSTTKVNDDTGLEVTRSLEPRWVEMQQSLVAELQPVLRTALRELVQELRTKTPEEKKFVPQTQPGPQTQPKPQPQQEIGGIILEERNSVPLDGQLQGSIEELLLRAQRLRATLPLHSGSIEELLMRVRSYCLHVAALQQRLLQCVEQPSPQPVANWEDLEEEEAELPPDEQCRPAGVRYVRTHGTPEPIKPAVEKQPAISDTVGTLMQKHVISKVEGLQLLDVRNLQMAGCLTTPRHEFVESTRWPQDELPQLPSLPFATLPAAPPNSQMRVGMSWDKKYASHAHHGRAQHEQDVFKTQFWLP